MKSYELTKLRKLVTKEIERRERIKELLELDLIKEYLKITNSKGEELDSTNISEILKQILASFSITETNGLYVCTRAYYSDWNVCYEETNYYTKNVSINSPIAESKIYKDIESGKCIYASKESDKRSPLITTFEKENMILNPYNTSDNENGYEEVRYDYFVKAFEEGQAKAKKLILTKYPKL